MFGPFHEAVFSQILELSTEGEGYKSVYTHYITLGTCFSDSYLIEKAGEANCLVPVNQ